MAQHTLGRRPARPECDQETDERGLLHEETCHFQGVDCFDRGVNFACTVIDEYIRTSNFNAEQILQITATLQKKVSRHYES
jgi:hypothetical protein